MKTVSPVPATGSPESAVLRDARPAVARRGAVQRIRAHRPRSTTRDTWMKQWHRHRRAFRQCLRRPTARRVHNLRITTRRLLTQLDGRSVAADRCERRRLKRLLRATARTRDAQVQLRLLNRLTRGGRPPDLKKFRRHLDRRARRFARELALTLTTRIRRLRPGRHPPFFPTNATVRTALRPAFERLRRRLQSARSSGDPDALHQARKSVKQCRYLADTAGVTGRVQLTRLHALQAALGELHDLDLLLARMESHATRHRRTAAWLRRHGATARQRRLRLWRNLPNHPGRISPKAAAGRRKGAR